MSFQGLAYCQPIMIMSRDGAQLRRTEGLARYSVSAGAHRWDVQIGLRPAREADAVALMAHRAMTGPGDSFSLPMPQWDGAAASGSGTVASAAAGDTSVDVTGTLGASKGRFISFADHDKVYMITSDVASASNPSLPIHPALTAGLTSKAVQLSPNLRAYYAEAGATGIESDGRRIVRIILKLEEAI